MRARMLLLSALLGACQGCSGTKLTCGPGTSEKNGACVPVDSGCGSGTALMGGVCVPSPPLACGMGTHEESGVCIPDPPSDPMLGPTPWSPNVRVGSADATAINPSIAVDREGHVFVAEESISGTSDVIQLWRSDDGQSFTLVTQYPPMNPNGVASGVATTPVVAIDGQDRVVLAFSGVDFQSGVSSLLASISTDKTSFPAPTTLAQFDLFSTPRIAAGVSADGRVAIVWVDANGISFSETTTRAGSRLGLADVLVAFPAETFGSVVSSPVFSQSGPLYVATLLITFPNYSGQSGDSIAVYNGPSDPVLLTMLGATRHFGFQEGGALSSDLNGGMRLVFANAFSRRVGLYESRSPDGMTWSQPHRLFDDPSDPASAAPSIVTDPQGGLHLIWADARTGGWLIYAADAPPGGDFGPPVRVSEVEGVQTFNGPSTSQATSIAFQNGSLFAAWVDPRGGVYFSEKNAP
jgi:hypothetical protein